MIEIEVPEGAPAVLDGELLREAAEAALAAENADPDANLTILVSGDAYLLELNRQFMGVNEPTDVLSFPAEQVDPETGELYLGDIAISLERAQAQAEAGGHSPQAELQLLVVHGVLHLLGYDHAEPAEKEQMWAAQAKILQELGVPLSPP